ncbi:Cytochrome o ubiquinol oxidase protein CyoD [Hafnia alvei]|uniref:Cytochrome bo(3) ubiquinol oxidase subunit 4 n=1 Tax=Hafnia alvei TaxID=569 RepID=A0A377PMK1_HAFAL|nr:Cytochrome o ubiquinol oxidase protein CyoD [Hafnia alvei]
MSHSPTTGHHSTDNNGASHGSAKSYMIGFILSVILTVIPFWMVMEGTASHQTILITVVAMAVIQIFVHLVYFLHMNTSSEERWKPDSSGIYRLDYRHCCRWLTLDYVQPQHQYDGPLKSCL